MTDHPSLLSIETLQAEIDRRESLEISLRQREADLRSLLENAEDFVVYRIAIDPTNPYGGRVVAVSPSIRELIGIEDPYRFEAWFEGLHPEDRPRAEEANRRAWQEKLPYNQVVRVYHPKKGQWIWVHTISNPVQDEVGVITHVNGLIVDVTEQKRAEESLKNLAAFKEVVTNISTRFINIEPGRIDAGIQHALQTIGEFAGVDRCYVFQFSQQKKRMDCVYEWCSPGAAPQIHAMKNVSVEDFHWSNQKLLNQEDLYIPRVADLPPEAKTEKEEFQRQEIQSLVAIPMTRHGEVVGFLGFDSVRVEKSWSKESIALLRIVGEMLVNALEHKRSQAIQAGQREYLELLAKGGNLSEIFDALLRVIEEQTPGVLGLILLLDEDGRHLHIGSGGSLPAEYVHSIEGLEIGPLVGSCGTACYRRERVIVEDIDIDPRWAGLRSLALQHGLRACWSEPVIAAGGQVLGTFAMYYRSPKTPTGAELHMIESAAHLVGVAIEHRRARQTQEQAYQTLEQRVLERTADLEQANQALVVEIEQRKRAEEALQISQALYSEIFENSPLQIFVIDVLPDGRFQVVKTNPAHERVSGLKPEQIWGKTIEELVIPEVAQAINRRYRECIAAGHPIEYEETGPAPYWNLERIRVFRTTLAPVTDGQGKIFRLVGASEDITEQKQVEAMLTQKATEEAIAGERNRLARDLHDAVTQTLFSTSLIAEVLPRLWERNQGEALRRLEELRKLTRGALAEMRTLLLELRPNALLEAETHELFRHLVDAFAGRSQVPVQFTIEGHPELPPAVKVALYRITQEALSNVAKHALASQVWVGLEARKGARGNLNLELSVRDNGKGFNPAAVSSEHLGLAIMKERAESIGAKFSLASEAGHGTQISVRWCGSN